jgi:hypothetical protein
MTERPEAFEACHWCGDEGHDPDRCDWVTGEEVRAEKRGRQAHNIPYSEWERHFDSLSEDEKQKVRHCAERFRVPLMAAFYRAKALGLFTVPHSGSEIPDDIQNAAEELWAKISLRPVQYAVSMIAAAILAEREKRP